MRPSNRGGDVLGEVPLIPRQQLFLHPARRSEIIIRQVSVHGPRHAADYVIPPQQAFEREGEGSHEVHIVQLDEARIAAVARRLQKFGKRQRVQVEHVDLANGKTAALMGGKPQQRPRRCNGIFGGVFAKGLA